MKHWTLATGAALALTAAATTPALAGSTGITAPAAVAHGAAPVPGAVHVAAPAAVAHKAAPVSGAVYFRYGGSGVEVLTHRGGWTRLTVGGGAFAGQFAVAPDGRKVAWIDDRNRLHVKSATGSVTDRVIAKNAAYGGPCLTPAWTADGKRIAYPVKGTGTATTVMVVGADGQGRFNAGKTPGPCHLTWSADGRTLAGYAGDIDGVYLLDTKWRISNRNPGIKLANHVESLSPDSRRVVVNAIGRNAPGGDGSWPLSFTPSIYDTKSGAKVAIPVRGRLLGARYLRDGRLAVRVKGATANTIVVLSRSGKEVQRVTEPARAKNLGLLWVIG
ncbi:TolB family protein [Streptosporangium sp. G11]|uniref:TolB family protein n=1 Tax=Streptosporangium sp. G11 TaxID=3436926 RepID=UPI003EBBC4C6